MRHHDPDFEALCEQVRTEIVEMSVEDVLRLTSESDDIRLIDVREDREWHKDHITGAMHIGRGVLERDIRQHINDKQTEMVLYCGGGFRSALAAQNLQKMGYDRVVSMAGGIKAWRAAGYPITTP